MDIEHEYAAEWWSLQLPPDWQFAEQAECTAFISESSVGVLQLSAARNTNGRATDADLRDFAEEHFDAGAPFKRVSCGEFTGFYLHFSVDDMYQRQWWLRNDDTVVLATYTSDLDQKGKDDVVVDGILSTIKRK